jgi:hypothetical protein
VSSSWSVQNAAATGKSAFATRTSKVFREDRD